MSSKNLEFNSIGQTIDGTTYCSAVETLAENLIEDNENDAVIVYPSPTSWVGLRSSAFTMTTENAEAHLPLPIYKIKKMLLKPLNETVTLQISTGQGGMTTDIEVNVSDFKDENGNSLELDITDMIVTRTEWEALRLATSIDDYNTNVVKDNTFFWEEGSKIIPFIGTVYKIHQINSSGFVVDNPTYARLLSRLTEKLRDKHYIYTYQGDGWTQDYDLFDRFGVYDFLALGEVRDWQFRIEYVPVTAKTKIRARKNAETQEEYIQPFNQRAEINAASAFGKNMYLTAQKTGCREITVVKTYTDLTEIPPLGALVLHNGKKYRLVANHYTQTNTTFLRVTHTLSENWSEKSKHVSVDQKYRNWSIPQDILWRNLYWEDYLSVSTAPLSHDNTNVGISLTDIMQGFYVENTAHKTVDTFQWNPSEDGVLGTLTDGTSITGVSVPVSTYGIANSLVFAASFKDNLSAGLRISNTEKYLCEEARYCKADGTLDKAIVKLGGGIKNYNATNYPCIVGEENAIETETFSKEFLIFKDAGEALKFTYQIHLIGEGDAFFGNKFAENHPLVKRWDGGRTFKVWLLTHYVREGSDLLEITTGDISFTHTVDNLVSGSETAKFSIGVSSSAEDNYEIKLLSEVYNAISDSHLAWAITDENNNLYVACNDITKRTLYFKNYHKKAKGG